METIKASETINLRFFKIVDTRGVEVNCAAIEDTSKLLVEMYEDITEEDRRNIIADYVEA